MRSSGFAGLRDPVGVSNLLAGMTRSIFSRREPLDGEACVALHIVLVSLSSTNSGRQLLEIPMQ